MSLYVSIGGVVLLVAGLGYGWWYMTRTDTAPSTATTRAATPSGPIIPETMLKIPEGTFLMGRNDGKNEEEKPAHSLAVSSFYMGRYEVTNKEYQEFVKAKNYPPPTLSQEERKLYKDSLKEIFKEEKDREPPAAWTGTEFPPGEDNLPVTNVSWNDAVEYCKWLSAKTEFSYRLPTEEEWEYTAKGTDQRVFPWGNNFDPGNTNSLERIQAAFGSSAHPVSVLQFKDVSSPFGTANQAGNVAEWTASMAKIYPGSKYPVILGDNKVVRGGSFVNQKFDLSTTVRNWFKPESKIPYIGFRVAMDQPRTTASK